MGVTVSRPIFYYFWLTLAYFGQTHFMTLHIEPYPSLKLLEITPKGEVGIWSQTSPIYKQRARIRGKLEKISNVNIMGTANQYPSIKEYDKINTMKANNPWT